MRNNRKIQLHKQLTSDIVLQNSGLYYCSLYWHEGKIHVMDNHRAAAWCWLQSCNPSDSFNFLHIDYHSDLKLDFTPDAWDTYNRLLSRNKLTLEEFLELRHDSTGAYAFSWENFIRPIHKLYPNWFKQAFFAYTKPFDIEEYDRKCLSDEYKGFSGQAKRLSEDKMMELLSRIPLDDSHKWIINLDLDYFFPEGEPVKEDSFIFTFAEKINNCMSNVQVLTIALSPSCCKQKGSLEDGWRNSIRVLGLLKQHLPALSTLTIPF